MNLYFRLLITILKALRAPRVTPGDTVELALRVLPTDLDLNGHMNNGRYLTLVDLGLVTVFIRSGFASSASPTAGGRWAAAAWSSSAAGSPFFSASRCNSRSSDEMSCVHTPVNISCATAHY